MNSDANSQTPESKLTLTITGLGHIPAIKNSMFAIVKPENREWKRRCVQSFVLQLCSDSLTGESATLTQPLAQSLIASLPQDDSWRDLPEINIKCEACPRGQEGATITIESIL
jgi:hypothetical protein